MPNLTEKRRLQLRNLARPSWDGLDLPEVLKDIAKLHDADFAAYYEVQWHASLLALRNAYPISYHNEIINCNNHRLVIPGKGHRDFTNCGLIIKCFHQIVYQKKYKNNSWTPIYMSNYDTSDKRIKKIYKEFTAGIKCEVALPIAQAFGKERQWIPLGVLLLSSRTPEKFDEEFRNHSLRETVRHFQIAANWDFLRRVDGNWSEIYSDIRDNEIESYGDFYQKVLNSLGSHLKGSIKYASFWSMTGSHEKPAIVLQHFKSYLEEPKLFDQKAGVKISYFNPKDEADDHTYHVIARKAIELYNGELKGDAFEKNEEEFWKNLRFPQNHPKLKLKRMKEFLEYYELVTSIDHLYILPILTSTAEVRTPGSKASVMGLLALYVADQAQKRIFDEYHLKRLSFVIGDGMYNVLRHKRRTLDLRISEAALSLGDEFEKFLQTSVNEFHKLISCQWIGVFIYDEVTDQLQLRAQTRLDGINPCWISIEHTSDPENWINRVFAKSAAFKAHCYYGNNYNISTFCKTDDISNEFRECIEGCVPEASDEDPPISCLAAPIIEGKTSRGLIVIVNVLRDINNTSINRIPGSVSRVSSFSLQDNLFTTHFAQSLAPYLSIQHYLISAEQTSILQSHEIQHQARAIVSNVERLASDAAFLSSDSNINYQRFSDLIARVRLSNIEQAHLNEIENLGHEVATINNSKIHRNAVDRLNDVERWGRNLLILSEARRTLETKISDLTIENCDIKRLLLKVQRDYNQECLRKSKLLVVDIPNVPLWIHSDPGILMMAIWNLISNSFFYSHILTPVIISARPLDSGEINISFTNYGLGIEPRDISMNIWKKRWRSQEAKKLRSLGTGMGLPVVKHVLKTLRLGDYQVSSELFSQSNLFMEYLLTNRHESNKEQLLFQFENSDINRFHSVDRILSNYRIKNDMIQLFDKALTKGMRELSAWGWYTYVNRALYKTTFNIKISNER